MAVTADFEWTAESWIWPMNYIAESKTDDIEFDHYFNADSWDHALIIAKKMGWKLVSQEESKEEVCAMIEMMMVRPRLH